MKFFVDTANVEAIKTTMEMGVLDGVTTNPSLISKENKPFNELVTEICEIVDGPVSLEVISVDKDGIVKEARELAKIADNVVVKVPLIPEGIKAVKQLYAEGIKTNVTLCFSPLQALVAAKAGATYISPFVGRLDDIGHIGMDVVAQIKTIYDNYGFETEVLVASIRTTTHLLEAALMGADVATIPPQVFSKILSHPLTDKGLANFLKDWEKVEK